MARGKKVVTGDLAVVIVNYNTRDHLLTCLTSLLTGGLDGLDAAVYVVDNASTDESSEGVRRFFPAVHVIESGANLGYAAANNIALRLAGFDGAAASSCPDASAALSPYRHALLLNPDTVVPPGALARLAAHLDAEPGLGAVGPKLLLPDGSLDLACRRSFPTPSVSVARFLGLSRLFPRSPRFGRYNLTHLDPDQSTDVDSVVGACMMVRGKAIRQVGLLDESFWMYGEDLDWSLRLHAAGWRVGYRPSVVIHHEKRAASRTSPRAAYEFQRAMWIFYKKHYLSQTPKPVHWLIVLALALRGGRPLVREMAASSRLSDTATG